MKDGSVTETLDGKCRLEEWQQIDVTSGGFQTWLVSKDGESAKLPEIDLGKDYGNSAAACPSEYHFSNDAKYLIRTQKIAHGTTGAYIYQRVDGPNYKAVVPDLYIQASNYFTRLTGISWYYNPSIVEFLAWNSDDSVAITLRGLSADKKFAIMGWRCVFSPKTGEFSISADWEASNRDAIHGTQLAGTLTSGSELNLAAADAQLNIVYRKLRERLDSEGRQKLKEEEIEWLHERDGIADPGLKLQSVDKRLQELQARINSIDQ